MGIAANASFRRTSSLPFQKMDEEVLVVDPRTRAVHLLNPTATRIWELLDSAHTESQLLAILADEFDAPVDDIRGDLKTLLLDLEAKGLIGGDPIQSDVAR